MIHSRFIGGKLHLHSYRTMRANRLAQGHNSTTRTEQNSNSQLNGLLHELLNLLNRCRPLPQRRIIRSVPVWSHVGPSLACRRLLHDQDVDPIQDNRTGLHIDVAAAGSNATLLCFVISLLCSVVKSAHWLIRLFPYNN